MSADLEIRIIAKDGATQVIRGVTSSLDSLGASAQKNGILLANASGKEVGFDEIVNGSKKVDAQIKQNIETVSLSRREFTALAITGVAAFNQIMASAGQTDATLSKVAKGAADIAIGFAFGGPVGAGVAALATGVSLVVDDVQRLQAEAKQAREDLVKPFEDAKKQIDALEPPVDALVVSLQKLLGVSKQTAQGIEDIAKSDQAYRDALKEDIALQEKLIEKQKDLENARKTITPNRAGVVNTDAVQAYKERVQSAADAEDELAIKTEYATSVAKSHAASLEAEKLALEYAAAAAKQMQDAIGDTRREAIGEAQSANGAGIYATALGQADGVVARLQAKTITLEQAITALNSIFGLSAAQVDMYTGKLITLDGQAQITANSLAILAGNVNAAASMAESVKTADGWMGRLGVSTQATGDMEARAKAYTDDLNASQKRLAEEGLAKAKAAWEQLQSAIRGAVESAVTATSVTDEDKKAAAMGKYVDKWDEFRRRVEAVATGTDMNAFGDKFAQQLQALQQKTGLTLDSIAAKFKNFSLFADKSNLKLIDWDAVVGSTADAVDAIIGKYNVISAGVTAYLNSDAGKAQLPQLKLALGLDVGANGADVQKALTGALGGTTGAAGGEASTFKATVSLDAKKALTDADHLKGLIADIPASKAGVTVLTTSDLKKSATFDTTLNQIVKDLDQIPSAADVVVTMTYTVNGTPPAGGSTTNGTSGPGRWAGGYVDKGLYQVGEAGREYVLPAGMVKWIEGILGGPIQDPRQIEWLVGALDRGEGEARNQLAMWAAGQTGSMVALPDNADKWLKRTYGKYAAAYGSDMSGSSAAGGSTGGGGGGGGGGLGGDLSPMLGTLQHMDHTLVDIRNLLGGGAFGGQREPRTLSGGFSNIGTLDMHGFN